MGMILNPYIFAVASTGYLVDDYSPEYCWTVERVDSADTDLVRVRRSSDNAESDFNGTEIADGTLTTWTGANDGLITTWYNVGTAGALSLTQATAANQPKLVSAGVLNTKNSQPSALFDGSTDENSSTTQILDTVPFSVFGVASNELNVGAGVFFSNRTNAGTYKGFFMLADRSTSKRGFAIDDGAVLNTYLYPSQINNNNLRIQSFTIDASDNGELWLDGVSQSTLTTTNTYNETTGKYIMLGGQKVAGVRDNVNVSLVMAFTTDQTSNQASIEADLNTIYATF